MPRGAKEPTKGKAVVEVKKPSPKRARKTAEVQPQVGKKRSRTGAAGRIRVTQVRSGIGHAATFKRTLRALGLKHHQDSVVVVDNPSIRGMIEKVKHLVKVEGMED